MPSDEMEVIKTDRLLLRKWREDDAQALYEIAKDPLVGPMAGWLPHRDINYSKAIIRAIYSAKLAFAIVPKDNIILSNGQKIIKDVPIGNVGLSMGPLKARGIKENEAELSYWLGQNFWMNGFATEAAKAIICYGFCNKKINKIWCAYSDGNFRSRNVMQKIGFKKDHVVENFYNPMLGKCEKEVFNLMTLQDFCENEQKILTKFCSK